ncbi:MAG: hypothetical protein NTZ74_00050 [Chloroflexi bacterium]|nr:hypothetical protein [Chloroflexota bacterium]
MVNFLARLLHALAFTEGLSGIEIAVPPGKTRTADIDSNFITHLENMPDTPEVNEKFMRFFRFKGRRS